MSIDRAPVMTRCRRAALAMAIVAIAAGARASDFSVDLAARRARIMERLGPDAVLILWSAPERRYSLDVDYEYRQDSNLYYLTGLTQPDTMLVLMPGNQSRREILFVKERNAAREHWTGPLLSTEDAKQRTGIDLAYPTTQFDAFVSAVLGGSGFGAVDSRQAGRFFDALANGRGKLALVLDTGRSLRDPLTPPLEFAQSVRTRFFGFEVVDAARIFTEARLVKTPYERSVLLKSLAISVDAQKAGMRAARAGAYEYEVKAAVEAVHRGRGAVSWSYPSIVGSGPNTTILHYPESDRQMKEGELLLVDAACNYGYMSGDITRTYPVSGTFSSAEKDLYQIVLQAQEEGARVARPGATLLDVHHKTVEVIAAGLLRLGLITDASGDQYRIWYTHGSSHFIGIDVHDVGETSQPLAAGMAFTIEPGIYIRQSALDALPRTPDNLAFIAKVQPAVRKYANIGIRVEDSFLLDESGLHNLSGELPRTIDGIESFLRSRK